MASLVLFFLNVSLLTEIVAQLFFLSFAPFLLLELTDVGRQCIYLGIVCAGFHTAKASIYLY